MNFPTIISIVESELDLNELLAQITQQSTGAAALFTGIVRGKTTREEILETDYLEYEAYQPMAETKMRQIAEEIREKWPTIEGIIIVQRIGRLYPGTISTLVGCASAHRGNGIFDAARFGIDRIKEIVPIWKKEIGSKGEIWVEGEYHPKPGE